MEKKGLRAEEKHLGGIKFNFLVSLHCLGKSEIMEGFLFADPQTHPGGYDSRKYCHRTDWT